MKKSFKLIQITKCIMTHDEWWELMTIIAQGFFVHPCTLYFTTYIIICIIQYKTIQALQYIRKHYGADL